MSRDTTDGKNEQSLSLDQTFEILKNQRRRRVLRYLDGRPDETVDLGTMAEVVAAHENDCTVEELTSKERKVAYVGLYQCHLPKMDNMDIVEFDQNRTDIRLAAAADQLLPYLRDLPDTSGSGVLDSLGSKLDGLVSGVDRTDDGEQSRTVPPEGLSEDIAYNLLRSGRRRRVFRHLDEQPDGALELTDLSEAVAADVNDCTVEELTKQERKRIYVSLYQTHVPMMEDAGVVDYDRETRVVRLGENAADLRPYIERAVGDSGAGSGPVSRSVRDLIE